MSKTPQQVTPIQRVRHVTYWTVVVIIFLPVVGIYGIQALAEWLEGVIAKFRTWAYRERYIAPWQR